MKNTKSYEELENIQELLMNATDRLDESIVKELVFSHPDMRIAAFDALLLVLEYHIDRGDFNSVTDEKTAENALNEFVNQVVNDSK